MKFDSRWSLTTTLAVNMLDLESRPGGWVKYQDVVRLMHDIEKHYSSDTSQRLDK